MEGKLSKVIKSQNPFGPFSFKQVAKTLLRNGIKRKLKSINLFHSFPVHNCTVSKCKTSGICQLSNLQNRNQTDFFSGTYFNCIMMMVASSVVLTVVVLNYHHRTAETHVMPMWVRSVFLQWLPWILRMDRPRKRITRKTIMMSNRMKDLELKEKDSKSLMANVLDMDDDFR